VNTQAQRPEQPQQPQRQTRINSNTYKIELPRGGGSGGATMAARVAVGAASVALNIVRDAETRALAATLGAFGSIFAFPAVVGVGALGGVAALFRWAFVRGRTNGSVGTRRERARSVLHDLDYKF
jgi:hypothetical protein